MKKDMIALFVLQTACSYILHVITPRVLLLPGQTVKTTFVIGMNEGGWGFCVYPSRWLGREQNSRSTSVCMTVAVEGTYLHSGVKTRFSTVTWPLWGGAYTAGGCIEQHGKSRRRTPVAVPPWLQQTSVALLAASHRPSPLLLSQEKHRQHITHSPPQNTPNTQ